MYIFMIYIYMYIVEMVKYCIFNKRLIPSWFYVLFKLHIIYEYRGYSKFLLNMAFISSSEVENIYIS